MQRIARWRTHMLNIVIAATEKAPPSCDWRHTSSAAPANTSNDQRRLRSPPAYPSVLPQRLHPTPGAHPCAPFSLPCPTCRPLP
jgi:hypothetical protein